MMAAAWPPASSSSSSSWPCTGFLMRPCQRRPPTARQGIVSCRLALEGFRAAWCASCRSARSACERRVRLEDWPALWESLVADCSMPDPLCNDQATIEKLVPVAETLLAEYTRRAEAQAELRRSQAQRHPKLIGLKRCSLALADGCILRMLVTQNRSNKQQHQSANEWQSFVKKVVL